ncbi:MAG: DUF669 domain-containing protein [Spirochaetes bacterium]|nr:MAG: DUF669 domain-containing protein [Spirochaetota bacterium]
MNILDLFDQPVEDKKEFASLPEGNYQVEIESVKIDEANQYGPQLAYTLKIVEESEHKNRKLWVDRKLKPETMWKVRQDLDALGYSDVKSANVASTLESLLGKVVNVNVSYAPNKNNPDKPYTNVNFVETSQPEGIPF